MNVEEHYKDGESWGWVVFLEGLNEILYKWCKNQNMIYKLLIEMKEEQQLNNV